MTTSLLKLAADFDTQLATASSIGATTATLVSATDDDGNALPTGLYGLTIDAGNSSKEYIICTLTSTALTGILSVTRQGVTSSGFARTHRRGAKVTLTDWAILKRMLNNLDGTTGFDSASPLSYDGNPTFTADGQIITKKYADDLAIAGSPDASTTVKGISKLSSAPASPTNPIAVGDNDTRVPTQDENNALVGTSGTPSSSNKYVTNDDTATTATASKVARRLAGGNITVVTETQGNNSTNAASTAYVDAGLTTISSQLPYTVNAVETQSTWFTYEIPILSANSTTVVAGWGLYQYLTIGATNNGAGGYSALGQSNNGGSINTKLPGTGSTQGFKFSAGKKWKMKFYAQVANSTNIWSLGLILNNTTSGIYGAQTTTTHNAMRIVWNSSTTYLANSDGTNYTANTVSVTRTNWNLYELYFNGTNLYCYVNGTLAATNSTNLPTDSSDSVTLNIGGDTLNTSLTISPITFSLEL